jgi:membrane associated rhomboid family serine protease
VLDGVFLALLGPSVEDALGRARFCALCLLGGLLALAARAFVDAGSPLLLLGASGAIAAVLGGYLPLHPRARVLTLVVAPFFTTLVEIPTIVLLGLWLVAQVSLGAFGLEEYLGAGGVAYLVHAGCFAFGLATIGVLVEHRKSLGRIATLR